MTQRPAPADPAIPRLTVVTVPHPAPTGESGADTREPSDQERPEQENEEQARAEAQLRLRRGRLATAIVAGALVLLVGVVAQLGGFQRRTDLLRTVAPGSVIATGPYEVVMASATVQHHASRGEWVVVASGTARTTGTTSIEPSTGDSGFVFARAGAGDEVQASSSIALSDSTAFSSQDSLTPGLPPVPWSVTFRFDTSPGDALFLAVFDQEYTTPYLFSSEKGWRSTRKASTMTLPLEHLPDSEY